MVMITRCYVLCHENIEVVTYDCENILVREVPNPIHSMSIDACGDFLEWLSVVIVCSHVGFGYT